MKKHKYYDAYDKTIGRRVPHVLVNDTLISLVTGTKQPFP